MKTKKALLRGKRAHRLWQRKIKGKKRVGDLVPDVLRKNFRDPDLSITRCLVEYPVGSRVLDVVLQLENGVDMILELKTCGNLSKSKKACVKLLRQYQRQLKDSYTLYKQKTKNNKVVHVFLLIYFVLNKEYALIKLI